MDKFSSARFSQRLGVWQSRLNACTGKALWGQRHASTELYSALFGFVFNPQRQTIRNREINWRLYKKIIF